MAIWARLWGGQSVGAAEARRRVAAGAIIVDVRSPDEVARHPVAGALTIPLPELAERLGEIPADRDVLTLCHSGVRSAVAAGRLADAGIRATSIRGGTLRYTP